MPENNFNFLCSSNKSWLCQAGSCLHETTDIYENSKNGLIVRACEPNHALIAGVQRQEIETVISNYKTLTTVLPFDHLQQLAEISQSTPLEQSRIGNAADGIMQRILEIEESYLRSGYNAAIEELEIIRAKAQVIRDRQQGIGNLQEMISQVGYRLNAFRLARASENWTPEVKELIAYLLGKGNESQN